LDISGEMVPVFAVVKHSLNMMKNLKKSKKQMKIFYRLVI